MVKTNEELHLIMKARLGCRIALNQLASEVYKRIYPILYRMTQDYTLAHDLLQETLLTMLKRIKKLRNINGFWGWIYAVAKNKVYDHYRKKHSWEILDSSDFDYISLTNHNPLEAVLENEMQEQIWAKIENLRKQDKDVVLLRHFEKRSYAEIASLYDSTPQQMRVRFFRAKQSLRNELGLLRIFC